APRCVGCDCEWRQHHHVVRPGGGRVGGGPPLPVREVGEALRQGSPKRRSTFAVFRQSVRLAHRRGPGKLRLNEFADTALRKSTTRAATSRSPPWERRAMGSDGGTTTTRPCHCRRPTT